MLLQLRRLRLHLVVQLLDAQHRADTSDQRRLLERLGEIIVAAGIEANDEVARVGFCGHENDGNETELAVLLELLDAPRCHRASAS